MTGFGLNTQREYCQKILAHRFVIPRYTRPELHEQAKEWFNRTSVDGVVSHLATMSDLRRIYVNYLRHETTDYDPLLVPFKSFISEEATRAISALRFNVYRAIAGAYPWLAAECARQLKQKEAQDVTPRHEGNRPQRQRAADQAARK